MGFKLEFVGQWPGWLGKFAVRATSSRGTETIIKCDLHGSPASYPRGMTVRQQKKFCLELSRFMESCPETAEHRILHEQAQQESWRRQLRSAAEMLLKSGADAKSLHAIIDEIPVSQVMES